MEKWAKSKGRKPNVPLFQHSNLFFLRNLRNLRMNSGSVPFSGPVPPAGLSFGGQLKGTGGGFLTAARAADIEIFQVCGPRDFRLQEKLLESKSAGTDEFSFPHGSCTPAKKWIF